MSAVASARSPLIPVLVATIAAATYAGFALWQTQNRLQGIQQQLDRNEAALTEVLGQVTRFRIEQSAAGKGPSALLEKLRTFAPLLASSRTTQPDYQSANKEMSSIYTAFASLGDDGLRLILARLAELTGDRDFDEVKHLLKAALHTDAKAGVQLLQEVLLGTKLPSARLRWWAAQELPKYDLPLAQNLLRQIVLTESARGFNPDRMPVGAPIPDAAALATTGFHNFISHYVRTDDPKLEDTLLQVMGRAEHDRTTVQECIKELGRRRCARAVPILEKVYQNPPAQQEDPLFQAHTLDALVAIQHEAARAFLERMLPLASTERTAKHIQGLLEKIQAPR